ncbi:MAG: hypothetical protein MI922_08140 [Bacteroidales bacterium]|nr:hypothetical protein [Bacteroidales bacterium]
MIDGFSKLTKLDKIQKVQQLYPNSNIQEILSDNKLISGSNQHVIEEFAENTIGVFGLPYAVAPNFLIDDKEYMVPMVVEESSVVAAASASAKYWCSRGGFHTEIIGITKKGHVHFLWHGDQEVIANYFDKILSTLLIEVGSVDQKMKQRGGGIQKVELIDKTKELANYYQLEVSFNTCNAMGANYMNTCLEVIASCFERNILEITTLASQQLEIIMSILSNYSPGNAVKVWVECEIEQLKDKTIVNPEVFASKFKTAMQIAHTDPYRAVTHNKGFYNGVDAVALATGNDWRAIESNGHAYASHTGSYSSISNVTLEDGMFHMEATIPMQVGTVGGITGLHPLVKASLQILNNPSAEELMKIIASVGLASNFAALKSLVTSGIQKGHMKMHLNNILMQLEASGIEKQAAAAYFENRTVSQSAVEQFLVQSRNTH